MPPDMVDIGKVFFTNLQTGKKFEIKGITDINVSTLDTREFADIKPIDISKGYSSPMINVEISDEFLEKLIGNRKVVKGSLREISRELVENGIWIDNILWINAKRNKVHKKHRINKKWAKRYGYTCTVFYE